MQLPRVQSAVAAHYRVDPLTFGPEDSAIATLSLACTRKLLVLQGQPTPPRVDRRGACSSLDDRPRSRGPTFKHARVWKSVGAEGPGDDAAERHARCDAFNDIRDLPPDLIGIDAEVDLQGPA